YDSRLFNSLWESLPHFGVDLHSETQNKRQRVIFSPTLRDGSMVRTGPTSVAWIGLESSPFQLLMAELGQLWWGPSPPPLWAFGSRLEVPSRDQLALALGSPKPSLLTRIADMEACDVAFVLEERVIRLNGRGPDAQRARETADALPYFSKIRSVNTSL